MASFSADFPFAFHVLPLHLWKSVVDSSELLCKDRLDIARPTTEAADRALGFGHMVHFYLADSRDRIPELPIRQAQLQPSSLPPFPHLVLELRTRSLHDEECLVCNWNLAVSRPGVPGHCKGGNWTRGTNVRAIRAAWDAFRELNPDVQRARGFFVKEFAVPVLTGRDLPSYRRLMRRAPRRLPELMLHERVPLSRFERVVAFSNREADLARQAGAPIPVDVEAFPGYDDDAPSREMWSAIEAALANGNADLSLLDFDRIRPAR